jgi:GDP-L-fucose synthase
MTPSADFWAGRRVVVTGGRGFLGSRLVEKLRNAGASDVAAVGRKEYDLRDAARCRALLAEQRPDVIIHTAAVVGGIGANRQHPGEFFYANAIMGIQLIEEARKFWSGPGGGFDGKKLVCLGTICAYPKFTPVPFREEDLWNGYPEETNAPYGLAKKMLLVQLQSYAEEYGFPGIYLLPVNLYGPGDNFDLETSHVIPAMIRKLSEARASGAPSVGLWGDGSPTREFLYVDDAADAILTAAETLNDPTPVNLGSGEEIAIRDLAERIRRLVGFKGEIIWDASRPNGQPRRRLDVTRARELLGFSAKVSLDEGLRQTIDWYGQREPRPA